MTHKYNSIQLSTVGKQTAQHIQTKISRPTMDKKTDWQFDKTARGVQYRGASV